MKGFNFGRTKKIITLEMERGTTTEGMTISISTLIVMRGQGTIIDVEKRCMMEGPKMKEEGLSEELPQWTTNLLTQPSNQSVEEKRWQEALHLLGRLMHGKLSK